MNTTPVQAETDPAMDFRNAILAQAKQVHAAQRFQLHTDDPQCKIPIQEAVIHATCIRVLQERMKSTQKIYLKSAFNKEYNAAVVYLHTKPISNAHDMLCIWRATKAIMNRIEIAQSLAFSIAVLLTVLGYEVHIDDDKEPFTAVAAGSGEWKEDAI